MNWRQHIARHGTAFFAGVIWVRWTFIALFVLAAVLRFWNFTNVPYTHDEISALVRIYPTLSETITRGVIERDTHPPGVQVFEWVWAGLFGMEEHAVKLPFTLLALAALFFLFRFAQAWTSSSVALVLTAILATLQYTVMYAQIARPYAIGFFISALLTDQLTRYLAHGKLRALVGLGIAILLSAYIHHFSLLLAGLIALSGLILISKQQRKPYLIMGGIIAVLYLPNVPIFLKQLGQGGLSEWLAKPDSSWMLDYAWWIAHCSWIFALVLGCTIVFSLIRCGTKGAPKGPLVWMLLAWGLVPLLIGLAYSIWRAPVIQYSVVLFSFPYLLILLLMGLSRLRKITTIALCSILAIVSTLTLIRDRHHYEVFYASKYEAIVRGVIENKASFGDNGAAIVDMPDEVVTFYQKLWKVPKVGMPHVQMRTAGEPPFLDSLLVAWKGRTIFYGQTNGAPPELVARIQDRFPTLLERRDYAEGQTFIFKDQQETENPDRIRIAYASLTKTDSTSAPKIETEGVGTWDIHSDLPIQNEHYPFLVRWDMTDREYGILTSFLLDTLYDHPRDQFEVVMQVQRPHKNTSAEVALELKHADTTAFYRSGTIGKISDLNERYPLIVAGSRSLARVPDPVTLRSYVNNRNKEPLLVCSFSVYRREANPIQYGLVEPIETLGRYWK